VGAAGAAVLVYTLQSLVRGRPEASVGR
jgi:hypothetical protein